MDSYTHIHRGTGRVLPLQSFHKRERERERERERDEQECLGDGLLVERERGRVSDTAREMITPNTAASMSTN